MAEQVLKKAMDVGIITDQEYLLLDIYTRILNGKPLEEDLKARLGKDVMIAQEDGIVRIITVDIKSCPRCNSKRIKKKELHFNEKVWESLVISIPKAENYCEDCFHEW